MNYKIGSTFKHEGKTFRVLPARNLNCPCDGCHFQPKAKNRYCSAPSGLMCGSPSRIFRPVNGYQPKKHTFWRNLKAWAIHYNRFMSSPGNRQLLEMNRMFNNQIF